MGAHFSIDVTEVEMFSGYEWLEFGDPCDHEHERWGTSTIGWGPDVAHYELMQDDTCGCRAWLDGRWEKARERGENSGFWMTRMEWHKPIGLKEIV